MSVCALGFFDGVHIGHKRLLNAAVEEARRNNTQSIAVTFEASPASMLGKSAPSLICTFSQKKERILALGIDKLYLLEKDALSLSGEEFARDILSKRLNAQTVVCGENYRFGSGAACGAAELRELGKAFGFKTIVMPLETRGGTVVSSSRIRELIQNNNTAEAKDLLG